MKASAEQDISIGDAALAAHAIAAGLVGERRFASGVVYLSYRMQEL